jgi:hypothetical protein
LTTSGWEGTSWGSWTVSQGLLWDSGGLLRGPWYQERVFGVYGFTFITIWSLIVSNLDETNLSSILRKHGPNTRRIIVVIRGRVEGGNQVREVARI